MTDPDSKFPEVPYESRLANLGDKSVRCRHLSAYSHRVSAPSRNNAAVVLVNSQDVIQINRLLVLVAIANPSLTVTDGIASRVPPSGVDGSRVSPVRKE